MSENVNESSLLGFLQILEKGIVYSIPVIEVAEVGPSLRMTGVSLFSGEKGAGNCIVMQANMTYHFAADLLTRAVDKRKKSTTLVSDDFGIDLGSMAQFLRWTDGNRKAARAAKAKREANKSGDGTKEQSPF